MDATSSGPPIGLREAARQLNVSASKISRQVRAGKIPNRGSRARPMVIVDEVRQIWAREINLKAERLEIVTVLVTAAEELRAIARKLAAAAEGPAE